MTQDVIDLIAHADHKITQASDAVSNQIALVFRLKSSSIASEGAELRLEELKSELRQWKEYKTLLFIRKGMIQEYNNNR